MPTKRERALRWVRRSPKRFAGFLAASWPRAYAWVNEWRVWLSGFLLRRYPMVGALLAFFSILATVWIVWRWLDGYVEPTSPDERTELVGKAAQIAGGAVLLFGAYWTARNVHVNREGQITERFTRAIDQLGAVDKDGEPQLEIRLGGIYALERIARDSPADHRTVMDVLTAYVRQNQPVPTDRFLEWKELAKLHPFDAKRGREGGKAPADIQAIATVLGRRRRTADRGEPLSLDLTYCDDLRNVNFWGAYLPRASFYGSDLEGAWFSHADLTKAGIAGTSLRDAVLTGANLRDAEAQDCILIGATPSHADLRGANVYGSRFDWANCPRIVAQGVGFHQANLDHADFYEGHLERTDFDDASLVDTSFKDSNLALADFRGIDLSRGRDLTWDLLEPAALNDKTILPAYLGPPPADDWGLHWYLTRPTGDPSPPAST